MKLSNYYDSKLNRNFFFISIFAGGIIFLIGLFHSILRVASSGITTAGRLGSGGGEIQTINGSGFIGIGIFILLWPLSTIIIYHLKHVRKNSHKQR
jgi:hypothetical protein